MSVPESQLGCARKFKRQASAGPCYLLVDSADTGVRVAQGMGGPKA